MRRSQTWRRRAIVAALVGYAAFAWAQQQGYQACRDAGIDVAGVGFVRNAPADCGRDGAWP